MLYDTVIIGGGPAGVAAGIYTARKEMKTLLITQEFGGQSVVSDEIQNWIGIPKISGVELAQNLEKHLRAQPQVAIKQPEKALEIKEKGGQFVVMTDKNEYQAKTLIVASGARRRKLDVPGAKQFEGKGIAYCSTCDAPIFADKPVAVVGGGNAGVEAVQDLIPYASEIYLLDKDVQLRADPITIEKIKQSPKLKKIIYRADIIEVIGDRFVSGLKFKNGLTGEEELLKVNGIFVAIGTLPNSEIVKDLVELNERQEIIIDHRSGATSHPAIFAAGDVADSLYKQNNISAGDGIKAALSAYYYLLKQT